MQDDLVHDVGMSVLTSFCAKRFDVNFIDRGRTFLAWKCSYSCMKPCSCWWKRMCKNQPVCMKAEWCLTVNPRDGIFHSHHTIIIDSYILYPLTLFLFELQANVEYWANWSNLKYLVNWTLSSSSRIKQMAKTLLWFFIVILNALTIRPEMLWFNHRVLTFYVYNQNQSIWGIVDNLFDFTHIKAMSCGWNNPFGWKVRVRVSDKSKKSNTN